MSSRTSVSSRKSDVSHENSHKENDKGKEKSSSLFRSVLTLEPGLVLHFAAAIGMFMVVQDFMMEKACEVNLQYGSQICTALRTKSEDAKLYTLEEKEVQKLVSSALVWRTFLENAFPMVLVFLIGAWSDKYGRKLPMLVVIGSFIIQNILLILCATTSLAGTWTVAVVSSLIVSLSGNQACFMVAAFSYAADNSKEEEKTVRTGITHTCVFLAMTLGLMLGGILTNSGMSWGSCFTVGVVIEVVSLLYLAVMMKNKEMPKEAKNKTSVEILKELFDFGHIREAFSTVLDKKREGGSSTRTKLWLLLLAHACCMMPVMGEMGVAYLFCRFKFSWDGATFGSWMTYKMVVGFIANFISMAVLTQHLKLGDVANGMVACTGNLVASVLFTLASSKTLMYLAPLATLLSGGAMIVPRAMITKLVKPEEIGKINSFIGSLESIIPFVASSLYTGVYTAYLDVSPGSFFLVSGGFMLLSIVIYGWLISQEKGVDKAKKS